MDRRDIPGVDGGGEFLGELHITSPTAGPLSACDQRRQQNRCDRTGREEKT